MDNTEEDSSLEVAEYSESVPQKISRKLRDLKCRYRQARTKKMLQKIVAWSDGNLVAHARRELPGFKPDADDRDTLMGNQLIELIAVFASHRHYGFSAGFATEMFSTLSKFKPIGPLTGEDSEWTLLEYADDITYQNKRCSHVFKKQGSQAYDINGKVFREPNGCCYTNLDSRVYITFPYVPKTEYVDVAPTNN